MQKSSIVWRIGTNLYLNSCAYCFLHDVEQVLCCCGFQIGFAADLAHLSGYVFKDHRRGILLKRHGGRSRLGFPVPAHDTRISQKRRGENECGCAGTGCIGY
jgi:hypothetical protein